MVSFNVDYQVSQLQGWTNGRRRTRMIPFSASRKFQGRCLFTRDKEQVLLAFMGKYCKLDDLQDDLQQGRQGRLIGPPEQMTMHDNADSLHDQSPRPGEVYEEPPDDEEPPYGRSYSDDGYSQEYLDYLHYEYHGGHHRDSDFLSDDYNVRSNDGDGDCAAG